MPEPTIEMAKRKLSRALLLDPRVSGVGIETAANGERRIKVYLTRAVADVSAVVPAAVEGYPVTVEVLGLITARAAKRG